MSSVTSIRSLHDPIRPSIQMTVMVTVTDDVVAEEFIKVLRLRSITLFTVNHMFLYHYKYRNKISRLYFGRLWSFHGHVIINCGRIDSSVYIAARASAYHPNSRH